MNGKKRVFFVRQAVIILIMTAITLQASLMAQVPVPVEISTEKIVTEGKVYYMHHVEKGQTLYSIARAYSVTVDMLNRENGLADNGIKEGQMLRIPAAAVAQGQAANNNTSAAQTRSGGQQTAGKPPVTSPSRPTQPAPAVNNQDERYIYHQVRRGETPGMIANEYGITLRELKRANKGMLFPHEGDYLMIPRNKISNRQAEQRAEEKINEIPVDTVTVDTLAAAEEKEVFTTPGNRTEIEKLDGTVRVAILFPFFIRENNNTFYTDSTRTDIQGNTIYQEGSRSAGSIYDGSIPFLEAYEGILVAVDSLRSLGLTVELDVYDTGSDTNTVSRLLSSGSLNSIDLIIGPVFSLHLEQIASWATQRDIPFISPVPLRDRDIVVNKPTLYRVIPSEAVIRDFIAEELRSHPDSKVIFLHADSAMSDPTTSALWRKVAAVTGDTSASRTGRLVAHHFTGVTSKRNVYSNVSTMENLLDADRENIIVMATTQTPIVSSAFSALHGLTKRYDIKVLGYPEIRGLETIDLKYYYDLELIIPTESYVDFESPAAQAFSSMFMKKFRTEPMAESFAWRGFDIAWYFIAGIATGGRDFLADPGIFNPTLLCLEPDFRRDSRQNGYENGGIFIVRYHKDMTIEIERPWPRPVTEQEIRQDSVSFPFSGSSGRNRVR